MYGSSVLIVQFALLRAAQAPTDTSLSDDTPHEQDSERNSQVERYAMGEQR